MSLGCADVQHLFGEYTDPSSLRKIILAVGSFCFLLTANLCPITYRTRNMKCYLAYLSVLSYL